MSKVINLNLRRVLDANNLSYKWELAVIKDDGKQEVTTRELGPVEAQINKLLDFAASIKSPEEEQAEALAKKAEEMLTVLDSKAETPDEKMSILEFYPKWDPNGKEYESNAKVPFVQHKGKLYQIRETHISDREYSPDHAKSLFKEVATTMSGAYGEWVKPVGTSKGYNINDRVLYKGDIYFSLIDGNKFSPEESATSWQKE